MVVVEHQGVLGGGEQPGLVLVDPHAHRHVAHRRVVVRHVTHRRAIRPAAATAEGRHRVGAAGLHGLAAEAAGPAAEGPLLEHVLLGRVDGPVVAFARAAQRLGQLDEALVEGEVVPHRVLPALVGTAEKGKFGLKTKTFQD